MGQYIGERIGTPPSKRSKDAQSTGNGACPEFVGIGHVPELELAGTDAMRRGRVILVFGTAVTDEQLGEVELPPEAAVASYERVVAVPEEVFAAAALSYVQSQAALEV